jgi:hypothetical protein
MNSNILNTGLRKTRSDASWSRLTNAQQIILEEWLFDEHLSFEEALGRAKAELGFEGSVWGLKRFYKKRAQARLLVELMESSREAGEVCQAPVAEGAWLEANSRLLARGFFERLRDEGIADAGLMGKLWLQAEANRTRRERLKVQQSAQEVRRERLAFQRERWQHDATQEADKILAEMIEFEKIQKEAEDEYSENKRINLIRKRMFGEAVMGLLLPESAEEEAARSGSERVSADKCG